MELSSAGYLLAPDSSPENFNSGREIVFGTYSIEISRLPCEKEPGMKMAL